MPSLCIYLKAHQPKRIRRYGVFDIGSQSDYFHTSEERLANEKILAKVAEKSYRPTNTLLLTLLKRHPDLKLSLSLTGVLLDQLEETAPDVLNQFQELVATGRVEILSETYHHSLSFFYNLHEFEEQVRLHKKRIESLFGVTPRVLSNTELAYNNELAVWADLAGYAGVVAEGWEPILDWRSPNYVYRPKGTNSIRALLKNYTLSDDVAFRFSDKKWSHYPLTTETYVAWLGELSATQTVNLFMDYETFGEHQWAESGIFTFLEKLPQVIEKQGIFTFDTVSDVIAKYEPVGEIDVPSVLTWADTDRDLSAWVGNKMQQDAIHQLYGMYDRILATNDAKLLADWRLLSTSDHFYYMCTKWFADGDVHAYFNPYETPYDACIMFMNVLKDMHIRLEILEAKQARHRKKKKVQ